MAEPSAPGPGGAPAAPAASAYDARYAGDYRARLTGFEIARWLALEHFVTRVLRLPPPRRVLDYGAGSGLHVELWERLFPGAELSFCDISAVAREKFREKHPRHAGRYQLLSEGGGLLADATYDVVVSIEVMEHVEDLQAYLAAIFRLLAPGGTFIWTTPCANRLSIEHVASALSGKIEATAEGYRRWSWEDPTHVRRLRSREIAALLRAHGFAPPRLRFRAHFFSFVCTYFPGSGGRSLRDRLMTLDYRLFRMLPNAASMIGAAAKPRSASGSST